MIRDILRKILPSEMRWRIKKFFLKKYSGERCYLYHNSVPALGTTERTHWILYNLALNYIPAGASVLDAGCGSGGGSYLISQKAGKVIAFDYSKAVINFARKNNQADNIEYILSNVSEFNYPEKFDAITMIEFLEHNAQPKSVLLKVNCLLKEKGMMIISFPRLPEGTPLKQGWHLHEFTDERVRDVFKDCDCSVKGLKNMAFVDSLDFEKEENFFVNNIEDATSFFIVVKKKKD